MGGYAAVVLAGGAGRRLGGVAKPLTPVGGRSMLDRVLAAVADAVPRVVVGPPTLCVPPGVHRTTEQPPGGGPVAGLAAGLSTVDTAATTAVLAADLPFLTRNAVAVLHARLSTNDGAVYVDDNGRRQTLCGVWRTEALRRRLRETTPHAGARLKDLLAGLTVVEVAAPPGGPPPWYDCDSPDKLEQAERWAAMATLEDWLTEVRTALALDDATDSALVLDLAREVAHGVARPAAPLSAYLLGLAVGRGADPRAAAQAIAALARSWPAESDG